MTKGRFTIFKETVNANTDQIETREQFIVLNVEQGDPDYVEQMVADYADYLDAAETGDVPDDKYVCYTYERQD